MAFIVIVSTPALNNFNKGKAVDECDYQRLETCSKHVSWSEPEVGVPPEFGEHCQSDARRSVHSSFWQWSPKLRVNGGEMLIVGALHLVDHRVGELRSSRLAADIFRQFFRMTVDAFERIANFG